MERTRARMPAVWAMILSTAGAACGDSTGPSDFFSGRYELWTVNGDTLPFIFFQSDSYVGEVIGGYLEAFAGGSVTSGSSIRYVQGSLADTVTQSISGTWSQTGDQVRLNFPGRTAVTGVLSGNQLTVTAEGGPFVYLQ